MSLLIASSPQRTALARTDHIMIKVCLATLPGLGAITWFFGWSTLIQIGWCILIALATEAFILKLRNRPIKPCLNDKSAVVTALLLGLSIPPMSPWWVGLIGACFAISFGKQLYGGLGFNPFNPAMLAYALLLISFPLQMSTWTNPIDAYTMATPLDALKTAARDASLTALETSAPEWVTFTLDLVHTPWAWVNLWFLVGGLYLLHQKIFTWHAPIGVLVGLGTLATIGYFLNPLFGTPVFHLLNGATCLAAFFIVTDPVSGATSNLGRLIFGLLVGSLVYVIRVKGGYPDAFAFAILLMNLAAPTLDHFTKPRVYGHKKANNPIMKKE